MTRGRVGAAVAIVAGALAAGVTFGFREAPSGALSGTWIGGYETGSRPVALHVELAQRGKRLTGTAEIGVAQKPIATPLRGGSVDARSVSFTLANGVVLEGRGGGRRVSGRAGQHGRFELYRLRQQGVA